MMIVKAMSSGDELSMRNKCCGASSADAIVKFANR